MELIPVLSLEYTRLVYAMPEICKELRPYVTLEQDDGETSAGNVAAEGVQTLNAGVDLGKTAIKSLAAVLAIDVVSDGDSDILGALFGQDQSSIDQTGSPFPRTSDNASCCRCGNRRCGGGLRDRVCGNTNAHLREKSEHSGTHHACQRS